MLEYLNEKKDLTCIDWTARQLNLILNNSVYKELFNLPIESILKPNLKGVEVKSQADGKKIQAKEIEAKSQPDANKKIQAVGYILDLISGSVALELIKFQNKNLSSLFYPNSTASEIGVFTHIEA